jgi:hypothetical protein
MGFSLVFEFKGEKNTEKPRSRMKDNIKTDFKEI